MIDRRVVGTERHHQYNVVDEFALAVVGHDQAAEGLWLAAARHGIVERLALDRGLEETDALGRKTVTDFDPAMEPVTVTGPDGKSHPVPGPAKLILARKTESGWTQTVVEDWPVALDVLSDCLFAASFPVWG